MSARTDEFAVRLDTLEKAGFSRFLGLEEIEGLTVTEEQEEIHFEILKLLDESMELAYAALEDLEKELDLDDNNSNRFVEIQKNFRQASAGMRSGLVRLQEQREELLASTFGTE